MQAAIRRLTVRDLPIVHRVLYLAIGWDEPEGLPPQEVAMQHPALAMYFEGWGRAGDGGCVATVDAQFAGAAYYRLFTEEVHGDGYIAPDVPEIAIAVEAPYRGLGIGKRLMESLAETARRDGADRLSLSVHRPNPARRLYERLGYETLEDNDTSVVMVLDLGA